VAGIEVGHFTDPRRPTGCTVVLTRGGAVAGVDVRGGAPGTRETDLLAPGNLVEQVHAVLLAGGSAWGLDAASGVMRWVEERGIGLQAGPARIPIVPAAVLFDLLVGDSAFRPDAASGYAACDAARAEPPCEGNVGAGSGAVVGKIFGIGRAMRGGIGHRLGLRRRHHRGCAGRLQCARRRGGPGHRTGDRRRTQRRRTDAVRHPARLVARRAARPLIAGTNTTIGVIATDAELTKAQAARWPRWGMTGWRAASTRCTRCPMATTLFALGTGVAGRSLGMMVLATMAAEVHGTCRRSRRAVGRAPAPRRAGPAGAARPGACVSAC
jgi:L-aminopeptidase/D-esterase-like protein